MGETLSQDGRAELHTSVVALGELKRDVERLRPKDPRFAAELERWLTRLIATTGLRILPVDQVVALEWGRIAALSAVPPIDGLLAATAILRGMTLVTRNVEDSADLGVSYLNPFEPITEVREHGQGQHRDLRRARGPARNREGAAAEGACQGRPDPARRLRGVRHRPAHVRRALAPAVAVHPAMSSPG